MRVNVATIFADSCRKRCSTTRETSVGSPLDVSVLMNRCKLMWAQAVCREQHTHQHSHFGRTQDSVGPEHPLFGVSEIHAQTDNQPEVVRLGLNAVCANLGVADAIPDQGDIQVKAFGQIE